VTTLTLFVLSALSVKVDNVLLTGLAKKAQMREFASRTNAPLKHKVKIAQDLQIIAIQLTSSAQRPLNVIKMRIVKRPTTVTPLTLFVLSALSVKVDNVPLTGLAKKVQMREFASRTNAPLKHKVKIAQDLQIIATQLISNAQLPYYVKRMEIVRRLAIVTLTKYAQLVKLAVTTNALMTGLASKTLKECVWKTYALLKIKMILAQVLQITVTRLISNVPLL
jgi:hypothetical protein